MTEDLIWRWLPIVILVVQGLFAWAAWSMRKKFVSCEDCAKAQKNICVAVEKDLQEVESKADGRLKTLEHSVQGLASSDDIKVLMREVGELRGGQMAMEEAVKGLGKSLDRIDGPLTLLIQHHLGEKS